jgi:proline dehydrogenase
MDSKLGHSHSHNHLLVERLLLKLIKKWAAGTNIEEAIAAAKICNSNGRKAILNYLGEDYTEDDKINRTLKEYYDLIERLSSDHIEGCISVKPSQLGLSVSSELCLRNLRSLVRRATELGEFIWIDMESSKYTDYTLTMYLELLGHHREIGVVLQSTLRRSASDLLHLIEAGGTVRLVKGAYHENEQIAFTSHDEINANFMRLLEMLFNLGHARTNSMDHNKGLRFAVATHDSKLIDHAIRLWRTSRLHIKNFEFEFLRGVRDELKRDLVDKGFNVAEYIPYGDEWFAYSARRLRERKRNLFLLARSLVS